MTSIVPIEHVRNKLLLIRGRKVILDVDLATLYGVATQVLVQAGKRPIERFPPDVMFQFDKQEYGPWWPQPRPQIINNQ